MKTADSPITKADVDAAIDELKETFTISTQNVTDKLTMQIGLITSLLEDRPVMTGTGPLEAVQWDHPARVLGRVDNNVRSLRMDAFKYTERWERNLNSKLDTFLATLRLDHNQLRMSRR